MQVITVWIFNLDEDFLQANKKDTNLWISLNSFRQHSVSFSDLQPYELPKPVDLTVLGHRSLPYYELRRVGLDMQHLDRCKAFVSRVLADFAFQWRHILLSQYNHSTFRRLACAIVRIFTLDFRVKEIAHSRQGRRGDLVSLHNLPEWDPFNGKIVRIGGISIVITQNLLHADEIVREDYSKRKLSDPDDSLFTTFKESSVERINGICNETFTYLMFSIQEIRLCQFPENHNRNYTKPVRLFKDTICPSDEAIEFFLGAVQTGVCRTPINGLPIEVQDMILERLSAGPVEAARLGCLLNIGSNFTWRCDGRNIKREKVYRKRTPSSPVESQIWFDSHFSGLSYK